MNRMRLVLTAVALLTSALTIPACENAVTQEALKSCKTEIESLRKTSSEQSKGLEDAKKQLAEAQGKMAQLTKENEELKAGKPHGASADKKAEGADSKSEPAGKKAAGKKRK